MKCSKPFPTRSETACLANTIPIDAPRWAKSHRGALLLAPLSLTLMACPGKAMVAERNKTVAAAQSSDTPLAARNASTEVAQDLRPTGAPGPAPKSSDEHAVSKLLGKSAKKMRDGSTSCIVNFVYAGQEPQINLWNEPCAKVDVGMIDRAKLDELGWWEKLDESARKFVQGMPGGKVLYVSGEFAASIFPMDETGTPYEVEVAD